MNLVDFKELENLKKLELIGRGKEGSCYLLEDGSVLKLYHILNKNKKIYFEGLNSDNIAFPKDTYIYDGTNLICGYKMNFLNGSKFVDGFKKDLCLSNLKQAIKNTRDEIIRFQNINMLGLDLSNLLFDYDKNEINILGAGRWIPSENSSDRNINTFNYYLMVALCKNLDWVNNSLNQDSNLHELYRMHKIGESLPIEFIEELESKMSLEKEIKVKTLGDLVRK